MAEPEELQSVEQLLFSEPLYSLFRLNDDLAVVKALCHDGYKFDAHCPFCKRQTTWTLSDSFTLASMDTFWRAPKERIGFSRMAVSCARDKDHKVTFWVHFSRMRIQKVGQYPSLATISNDEARDYKAILTRTDAAEFHKAIGLAAHGVGVGSFVYLRRVFERLIYRRFEEFKDEEGWNSGDFLKLRMTEKIDFLSAHLPPFLVEHSKIYGILSAGIHELEEEQCLAFFSVLKESIVIILEEDKKKREELDRKKRFSDAIKQFGSGS